MRVRVASGVIALLALLILATPALAEWRRAESPHFVLYGEQSERALRERILLLENFDRLLRQMTTVDAPPAANRFHIYILGSARELRAVRAVPSGVEGFYTATAEGIGAFVNGSSPGTNEILFHEYAHHFMRQHRPLAYPAWYVEGFAEYFMTAQFNQRRIDIGGASPGRAYLVLNQRWLPMRLILSGEVRGLSQEERAMFYAQSWLLTHYFYSTEQRRAALAAYLGAARTGDPVAALAGATGFTPDQLESELNRYIRDRRIPGLRIQQPDGWAAPAVTVTALSPGADAVIADAATLRIGVGESERAPLLARLRAAHARFPDDGFVRRTLAHAEALYGDGAAADRLLDPLLAASPNDAELMYLKGRRYLAAAERGDSSADAARSAREWFGRAYRADGNHYQTLYRYAQSQTSGGNYLSENTANVMLLANQLAPQVHEITMNTASLLIRRGQRDEAIRLLEPLAVDPHDGGLARAAARLLAEARGDRDQGNAGQSESQRR